MLKLQNVVKNYRAFSLHCSLELKSGHIVFSGGGALLLRRQIEASGKVVHPVFIDDVAANVRGFQLLYQAERLGHNGR